MIKVEFPRGDDILEHLSIAIKIINNMDQEFKKEKKISLDFSDLEWFIPCSMILISNKIKEFFEHGALEIKYKAPVKESVRKHMEKIGFPLGKNEDGDSYVSLKHFKKDKKDKNQINKKVNELINSIEGKIPCEFGESVKYILGELSDNIDDHSEFEFASLMAQYFPTKEILDIAVFDNGISIPTLFEKHKVSFENDQDAIKKAVWGEVTTKEHDITRGYGLKTCKKLSIEGLRGELYIISRKGILRIKSKDDILLQELSGDILQGTFIYLRLKTPKNKLNIYEFVE